MNGKGSAIGAAAERVLAQSGQVAFPDFVKAVAAELGHAPQEYGAVAWDLFCWLIKQDNVSLGASAKESVPIAAKGAALPKKNASSAKRPKVAVKDFVYAAIEELRDPGHIAVHTVYSGFNQAFREFYRGEGLDPIAEVNRLVKAGLLKRRFVKGGALISNHPTFKGSRDISASLKKMEGLDR